MAQILIVEDDPFVQRVYQRLFSAKKYSFEMVSTGIDGLAKAKSLKPKLILLDIMMVPMDGMAVLKKLKSKKETKNIPVVMLTNLGEEEYIKRAYANGAAGYMIKSDFEPKEIIEEVDKYLKSV
jgi:two-component system, OmpR family, alkaline phosphatase synthesis response regulator PhoP